MVHDYQPFPYPVSNDIKMLSEVQVLNGNTDTASTNFIIQQFDRETNKKTNFLSSRGVQSPSPTILSNVIEEVIPFLHLKLFWIGHILLIDGAENFRENAPQ